MSGDEGKEERATEKRKRALARHIGETLCDCDRLIPLTRHGDLHVPMMPLNQLYFDTRLCDLAWWAVASRIRGLHDGRVMDHAWLLGFPDPPREPWGFVTEPYIEHQTARRIAQQASELMAGWGAGFAVLSPEMSAWNPGRCVPIVAFAEAGSYDTLVRRAVTWALVSERAYA